MSDYHQQPYATLFTGAKVPMIGLGTWKAAPHVVAEAIKVAVKEGYRHIDCASNYLNEAEVGDALADIFAEGHVKREDLWITGKLNNPYHRREHVMPHLKKTLKDLRLEYLDIWLMRYWPVGFKFVPYDHERRGFHESYDPDACMELPEVKNAPNPSTAKVDHGVSIRETWEAMEECVEAGLVKHIGLSNVTGIVVHDLMSYAKIKPAMIQNEMHPYCQQPNFCTYAANLNILLTAYSPLGTASNASWTKGPTLLEDKVLAGIAKKHHKTVAQVCIRWAVQRGTLVIPKSTDPGRLRENINIMDFKLDDHDMEAIKHLDKNFHYLRPFDWYGIPLFTA